MFLGETTRRPNAALRRLDSEAVRLRRHRHRRRLRFGQVLLALGRGYQELGFRNFAAYVRERLSLPVRWCVETRAMARRLAELPRIRRALLKEEIGWAMAELLSRHATAHDEEELLEACRGETVRAVRRILKERGREPEPEPDVEDRFGALSLTLPIEHAIGLEAARRQVEHVNVREIGHGAADPVRGAGRFRGRGRGAAGTAVNGGPGEPGSWLECLLMEAHTTLLDRVPEAFAGSEDVIAELRGWVQARRVAEQRNVDAEERARPAPMPPTEIVDAEEEEAALPVDPVSLDRELRQQARQIASEDVWLGRVLEKLFAARAWERLGYATETQYALDRLGMSRSAVRQRIRLTRKARWLEGLDEAIQAGRIGTSHAALIARVADPDTLEAWIERSTRRTYKHLAEEVELADLVMRFSGDGASIEPPSEDDVKEWERVQADWLSGAQMKRFAAAVDEDAVPTPSTRMLECGDEGEPVWQHGAHLDEVEQALAAILRRREGHGGAVQMSGGSTSHDGGRGAQTTQAAVQVSGGSAMVGGSHDMEATAGAVQMSGAAAMLDDSREAEATVGAVQMSGGSAMLDGAREAEATAATVQMSGGSAMLDGSREAEATAATVQMSGGSAMLDGSRVAEATAAAVQMSGGSAEPVEVVHRKLSARSRKPSAALLRRVDKSARRRQRRLSGGMASATIIARNDVVVFYRELEAVFAKSGLPGTFVELLLADFWLTWGPAFEIGNKWKPIHDRDRHQCTCPVCFVRKSLSNHHVRYRAHGGGDEMENQIIACDFCHLDGEHGGRLRVRGTAERPVWLLGRTPIMRVEGREKIELNPADRSGRASAA